MTTPRARVALTFDTEHPDRPSRPGVEARILDVLRESSVRATFFVQGRWAEAHPELGRRIVAEGHVVGSHSHYHARMPLLSDAGLATDIRQAETAIREHLGVDPRPWFRLPFGAGMDDPRVLEAIAAAGYAHVGWDVVADDWEPARSGPEVESAVIEGVRNAGDGAVVLLHAWPDQALDALPGIIGRLTAEGWSFETIDDLPQRPPAGPAVDPLGPAPLAAGALDRRPARPIGGA